MAARCAANGPALLIEPVGGRTRWGKSLNYRRSRRQAGARRRGAALCFVWEATPRGQLGRGTCEPDGFSGAADALGAAVTGPVRRAEPEFWLGWLGPRY